MKAITEIQPYGSLIIAGIKHIETRGWYTSVRGRIAIHAGRNDCWLKAHTPEMHAYTTGDEPLGAVLGTVELVDCIKLSDVPRKYPKLYTDREILLGDWSEGRYGFILRDPIKFAHPIPARGHQGWWNWEGGAENGI